MGWLVGWSRVKLWAEALSPNRFRIISSYSGGRTKNGFIIDTTQRLPKHTHTQISVCSHYYWTAETYVAQNIQHGSASPWLHDGLVGIWMALWVTLMIAFLLQYEIHKDLRITLFVVIPTALLLVCLFILRTQWSSPTIHVGVWKR